MASFTDDDIGKQKERVKTPGTYLAEVVKVKEKKTQYGDEMFALRFQVVDSSEHLCFDNLVFSDAAKGISASKAKSLGIEKNESGRYEFEAGDLVGLRVNLTVRKKSDKPEELEPDFNADGFGYQPVLKQTGKVPF